MTPKKTYNYAILPPSSLYPSASERVPVIGLTDDIAEARSFAAFTGGRAVAWGNSAESVRAGWIADLIPSV